MPKIEKISQKELENFKKFIDEADTIAISAHINPDGDALGSALGLRKSLELYGKKSDVIKISEVDDYLNFLPQIDFYKNPSKKEYDLFIIVDCSEFDRIDKAIEICKKSKKVLVIDHHEGGSIKTDLNIIHSDSPASCELVYEIIKRLKLPIDKEIATLLYAGLVTDTGRFLYSNISELTFYTAADLYKIGADFEMIYKNLYQNKEISKLQFENHLLNKVEFKKPYALVGVSQKICKDFGVQMGDSESVVNMLRDLKGIEVACLVKEYGENEFKISLRSKDYLDVSKIARDNGGGGHIRASGFTINTDSMDKAINIMRKILEEAIND
ncbi:bifunctional oligoribonuclease/PAP phosphatase NrnA [Anaerococcus obesiensis]|uniref:Bifunctional oligoribonuclease/PAP phosphatase NrnA n=1 Tax=Anaerococcus obesiensis TaxID=1287640 RepID=A0A7T7USK6_9FIRM|nr:MULTISPECIES: bifunctional oligoribonuclease/PAP phosphatase NrnA [Anaerococcus]MDU1030925.1 bifunctional oligoribonuclease/PAP phosphatase NrnA [Anaerococcus vaginalis]QQN55440.1 bifunctional oligoribonuclease/PAP phosphatase NrnA [Anaerococcus obesiensis]